MQNPTETQVKHHYACPELASSIRAGLESIGKTAGQFSTRDLAAVDQLHTGGPKATIGLVKQAGLEPGAAILDAGCGIGGSTRLLAEQFDCTAIGIDLSPDFIDTARILTRWCGLEDETRIQFHQGTILDLPFEDQSFDAVLCQHILMNIEDKARALDEFYRVLKPAGRLILHEIVDGPGPVPLMPVPWAADDTISFVPEWNILETMLTASGFIPGYFRDETQAAAQWWQMVNAIREKKGTPKVHVGLIFGAMADHFGPNLEKNFSTRAIGCIEAILTR